MFRSLVLLGAGAGVARAGSAACNSPVVAGTLPVSVDGVTLQWSVVAHDASSAAVVQQGAMTMNHDARGYLLDIGDSCPQGFDASIYTKRMQLLGKQLNYTVDLSTAGCACNAALYLVAMPAVNSSQKPDPTRCGDYYCDANMVCGLWCPEIDVMEANTAALQATPHRCEQPTGGWYPSCDKDGCGVNSYKTCGHSSCYGAGPSYSIDTTREFVVSTSFVTDAATGSLVNMTTLLVQGGRSVALPHNDATCGAQYLEDMTAALAGGMVMTFSVWGSDAKTMSWLDMPPCDGTTSCSPASTMTISGISIATLQ